MSSESGKTRRQWLRSAVLCLCVGLSLIGVAASEAANPDALWDIVHGLCVPDQQTHGSPAPCAVVDLTGGEARGYAVLKDLAGATQFLLIPTAKITRIESPAVLAPDAPNYFALAWQRRALIEQILGRPLPRDDMSLAVNSVSGRSQNQLHIHMDCAGAQVRQAVEKLGDGVGRSWAPFPVPLAGHRYMAMRVYGSDLSAANPFRLLADGLPGARADMGDHTLVVVGTTFSDGRPGFILFDDRANLAAGDVGSGEELQDHTCTS